MIQVTLIELTARRSLTPVGAHVLVAIVRRPAGEHFLVFPQHESEVTLHAPSTAQHPSRLVLESRGAACEVGRFLTEDERRTLAARLKQLVGNTNELPAL